MYMAIHTHTPTHPHRNHWDRGPNFKHDASGPQRGVPVNGQVLNFKPGGWVEVVVYTQRPIAHGTDVYVHIVCWGGRSRGKETILDSGFDCVNLMVLTNCLIYRTCSARPIPGTTLISSRSLAQKLTLTPPRDEETRYSVFRVSTCTLGRY